MAKQKIMGSLEDQLWNEMNEKWAGNMYGDGHSPAF